MRVLSSYHKNKPHQFTPNLKKIYLIVKFFRQKMPLVVITGVPSSGKTTRANELKEFFEKNKKQVFVVSENEQITKANFEKNQFYSGN